MIRPVLLGLLLLIGCANTGLSTNIGITPSGVRVTPVLRTQIGGANIAVSP